MTATLQGALFEDHALARVRPAHGRGLRAFHGVCRCGWESRPMRDQRAAQLAVTGHCARVIELGTP